MQVVRITVDLLRPVPIAPLKIRTEVLREGRKIQLCAVTLAPRKRRRRASDRAQDPSRRARAAADGRRRESDSARTRSRATRGHPAREAERVHPRLGAARRAGRNFASLDPAAIWFRVERPLFEGQVPTPLRRVAMIGDFCNGVSTLLDFRSWTFINGDLTISLARLPVGDWILLDAQSWLGDARRRDRLREARRQPRLLRPRNPEPGDRATRRRLRLQPTPVSPLLLLFLLSLAANRQNDRQKRERPGRR